MPTYTYQVEHIEVVLKRMAEACAATTDSKAVGLICTAAANLIGLACYGQANHTARVTDLMHVAVNAGFLPEFYGNGVRVNYIPKQPPQGAIPV